MKAVETKPRRRVRAAAALLLLLAAPAPAAACPEPVFRFALENWRRDPYEVTVFTSGAPAGEAARTALAAAAGDGPRRANIRLRTVELSPPEDGAARVEQAPWMEVRYPGGLGPGPVMWNGPLGPGNVEALIDSPLRRKLGERLLAGDTAAWVFLAGGDRRRDREAERALRETLARLEKTLHLPDPEAWDREPEAGNAREISFPVFVLDRAAPTERMLVEMLLGSEPDLRETAGQPMVFPVFGRGRVLYALVGAGINERTITRAAEFLTGPCSCMIKALNPGTDLLTALDWEGRVERKPLPLPVPTGLATFPDRAREAAETLDGK